MINNTGISKTSLKAIIEKYKYPFIVLVLGVSLMLIPTSSKDKMGQQQGDEIISEILSSAQGVGNISVLISDNGVIVVCQGADKPSVRLDIIDAVSSYTGFSSDRISILKMTGPA